MRLLQRKLILSTICLLFSVFSFFANCQTTEQNNPAKKYDEIIKPKQIGDIIVLPPRVEGAGESGNRGINESEIKPVNKEVEKQTEVEIAEQKQPEKDELVLLLPKLDNELYKNWTLSGEPKLWKAEDELLLELGIKKVLKQTYGKENHLVDVFIYNFNDFAGAYSAYTILHKGTTTKLKVGKNASESENLINFWKSNYFISISTSGENDSVAKEFIVLASQDISKNIQQDQLPPVIAIQLPALYRTQASERYCTGPLCCLEFVTKGILDVDCSTFNIENSGGIIAAEYQLSSGTKEKEKDKDKSKERLTLILSRYTTKEDAQSVFNTIRASFEGKKLQSKDMDVDVDINDGIVKIKNKKNDYTMLKQKGNLLALVYGITNKKSGEQILDLVPWPIEIIKPINTVMPSDEANKEKDKH